MNSELFDSLKTMKDDMVERETQAKEESKKAAKDLSEFRMKVLLNIVFDMKIAFDKDGPLYPIDTSVKLEALYYALRVELEYRSYYGRIGRPSRNLMTDEERDAAIAPYVAVIRGEDVQEEAVPPSSP